MTGVRRAALLAALGGLLALLAGPGVANAAVTATDGQFTYTGTWNTVTGTNHEHWTAQVGATAKINFVTSVAGQTVTLKGVKGVTSGNHTANVVIDASAPAVANEATGTGQTQNATVWTSGAIGVGNHTLTLTVTQAEFSVENLTLTAGSFGGPGYTPPPPPVAACGDGLDNDGDGLVDYPADPGCTSTSDTDETDTTSGTGLPVGDLPGWHQTYAQDFTTAATPAQFAATYPRMFPYADNGTYAQSNISVGGGSLNINERADGVGAAVVVRAGSDTGWGQTYGRYSVRFRADAANNFGSAFLLWPDSNVWGDGETDYPEGNFADQIHVYEHCLGANAPSNCLTVNTGASWQAWHVATTEWSPTSVKFYLDGTLIGTDTSAVSTASRHWVMQTAGSAGTGTGKLQIDWVALYARVG
jgi:hypothetical protein